MEQLQQIWNQTRELYRKLPEIVRFVLETLCLLTVWTASTKIIGLVWSQFEKIKWMQQVEAHLDKVIIYIPFALIAVLFLLALNRIAELLNK